jgi:hypothetical protein
MTGFFAFSDFPRRLRRRDRPFILSMSMATVVSCSRRGTVVVGERGG